MAQGKLGFQLEISDNPGLVKKLKTKSSYRSQKEIEKDVREAVSALRNEGYLLADTDTLLCDSIQCRQLIHAGPVYRWASLRSGNVEGEILAGSGYSEKFYAHTRFSPRQVSKLMEKLLTWCDNNGYPFARVSLDSISIDGENISAVLHLRKNKFIRLDSVLVQGNAQIRKNFLFHYLHLREGDPYNEKYIRLASQRLRQLPFLRETRPQLMKITETYNKLFLYLDKKNASQFDGILGLQPQNNGKTVLTGDVRVRLHNNIFHAGELLDLNWRRLQYQTQDFKTAISYPYLFRTPVGADYAISIYKRDTTFLDVQNSAGLQYLFSGLNNVKVFYRQRNTSLLSTAALAGLSVLPDYADIATYAYGIGLFYENLDYKFNPRKGFSFNASGSAGNRSIRKNNKLSDALYTNVQLKTTQYQSEGSVAWYIPLLKFSTLKFGAQGGGILSPQLFRNELFRIGGFRSLRGFDEQSIFASSYAIATVEYRFLFEQNSAFVVFSDGGWYEYNGPGKYVSDTPYGIGAGFSFETKAGIFQMNYAVGSQFGNPFDLRTGKVNFGLVNTF